MASDLTPAERRLFPERDVRSWRRWQERGVKFRLEAARRSRGLTQKDLAAAAKIGEATLRRMEARSGGVSVDLLARCAVVLDVPIESLIEAEDCWFPAEEEPPRWRDLPTSRYGHRESQPPP